MIDLYLKAASWEAMRAALIHGGFVCEEEGTLCHPRALLDEIGTLYQETGRVTLVAGEAVPETQAVDGYHVNLRLLDDALADGFRALAIHVDTPARVWA
ncbi:hypothetical protein BUE93_05825 [Chromobacterium amazonense]|uniref:Uncharacterized protein n=1 Tax=Chromobacterium amazonense TaxID=1382803 RepID=A0A2S9X739_9NEIS|nr:hypothetical protein [Chromobacterium amazonense]PRP71516.1 hypothetical protein BUE93_05825 [Chromobacterium amazonense]